MKSFYTDNPEGKFVALFADGSGADIYWRLDDEGGFPSYCDAEGDLVPDPETYFIDAGYSVFIDLPENFELFFENRG